MLRPLLSTALLSLCMGSLQAAKVWNFTEAPGLAAGDGVADNAEALKRAFSALTAGDTLLVPPGNYRVVLEKSGMPVPAGVTVQGRSGKSTFLLESTGGKDGYREFLRLRSGVTLEGIGMERAGDFPAVLLPIGGDVENLTLMNCRIDGKAEKFPQSYVHGFQVGMGRLKNFLLDGLELRGCTYGLFQANASKGTVEGVLVQNSRFERNVSSDLEFNAPNGTMRDITVRDCLFRDNLSKNASGGFAVGFANVQKAVVERCRIENYGAEALHVEDRSSDIRLTGNTLIAASTLQSNGIILVVNNSTSITIEGNSIDARTNANKAHAILVTAGGSKFPKPTGVVLKDNVILLGAVTPKWYLEPGSSAEPVGNVVVPFFRQD